jgi:hypothetical protein
MLKNIFNFKFLEIDLISKDKSQTFRLRFKIKPTSIAQRWARALREIFNEDLLLEKHYNFLGFAHSPRGLPDIAIDINEQVKVINDFSWNGQYTIEEKVNTTEIMDQDNLNALHNHFEILIGQVWKRASWFKEAPRNVQVAILLLNNYIHEYEFKSKALTKAKRPSNEQTFSSALSIAFTAAPHFDLLPCDFTHFSLHRTFGDVFLHYSQLGKTFEEAFNDKDEYIDEENISGLRYYTGEFDIHFGETGDRDQTNEYIKELHNWLKERGINPDNKSLALGEIKVAELDKPKKAPVDFESQLEEKLSKEWNINSITLKRGVPFFYSKIKRSYPYAANETAALMEKYFKLGNWRL